MKKNQFSLFAILAAALTLASCSGLPNTADGGGGGTTTFSLTAIDAPPPGSSILSFKVTITGITVNPASGSAVAIPLIPSSPVVEFAPLQSDSISLGTFTVTSGTYNSITVAVASPDIIFLNQSGGPITGTVNACPNNAVCEAKPPAAGMLQVTSAPFPLTLSVNGQQGMSLDFNLNNAITFSGGSIGVDFTQANILGAANLPRSNLSRGQLDLIEDFTGVVTNVTASSKSVTVQSATRGTLTATANSSTVFDDPFAFCTTLDFNCVQLNQTVSVDAVLNADGTFSLKELEPFDKVAVDRIEGIVVSKQSATQFQILTTEKVAGAITTIGSVSAGDIVNVTLAGGALFFPDRKGLSLPPSAILAFSGALTANALLPGQTVSVRVTNFIVASGSTPAAATVDEVGLRFSRVSGTVSGPTGSPFFNITALPPIITNSLPSPPPTSVQTFTGTTNFDGVTDVTGLADTNSVSIRALYISVNNIPAFFAAKVRKH